MIWAHKDPLQLLEPVILEQNNYVFARFQVKSVKYLVSWSKFDTFEIFWGTLR